MKSIPRLLLPAVVLGALIHAGCEIDTLEGPRAVFSPSPTVVINEVFTLSATDPSLYSWIEFYNPTAQTVDVSDWTLECRTTRLRYNILVGLDSTGDIAFRFDPYVVDFAEGTFPVPIFRFVDEPTATSVTTIAPKELLTIVDNETRLKDHTDWGPSDEPRFVRSFFQGTLDQIDTLSTSDTLTVILAGWSAYVFSLKTTDQLVLRNGAGDVVDVVRYGAYRWAGPGADPYPGNVSIGLAPPYESFCRYAGGFKTSPMPGNSANDFYITDRFVRPIPHWFSQKQKIQ